MPALDNFRQNLRRAMENRGLSQRAVAEKADMGYPYVNRVLQGKNAPSVPQAEKLAKAVGVALIDLLTDPKKFSTKSLTSVT